MKEFIVTEKLVVHRCYSCGIIYALPEDYNENRRSDHVSFKCPNGHSMCFPKKTEKSADALKAELDSALNAIRELKKEKIALQAQLDQQDAKIQVLEEAIPLNQEIPPAPDPAPLENKNML